MGINIGYAQDIITPTVEKPCYLAGFGRKRRAVAVHDDLYVRALALDDVLLFAVPGELLPKLGLNYRQMMKAAGAELTGIIGLANDELGYILPRE
ncbi:MAG: hypothetical protein R3293_23240, partial [Candidatus Promineifilaceae bacterium]|nr:hypothetical protein [Candidatus Promineifilaceae bacterium]